MRRGRHQPEHAFRGCMQGHRVLSIRVRCELRHGVLEVGGAEIDLWATQTHSAFTRRKSRAGERIVPPQRRSRSSGQWRGWVCSTLARAARQPRVVVPLLVAERFSRGTSGRAYVNAAGGMTVAAVAEPAAEPAPFMCHCFVSIDEPRAQVWLRAVRGAREAVLASASDDLADRALALVNYNHCVGQPHGTSGIRRVEGHPTPETNRSRQGSARPVVA